MVGNGAARVVVIGDRKLRALRLGFGAPPCGHLERIGRKVGFLDEEKEEEEMEMEMKMENGGDLVVGDSSAGGRRPVTWHEV